MLKRSESKEKYQNLSRQEPITMFFSKKMRNYDSKESHQTSDETSTPPRATDAPTQETRLP